MSKNTAKLSLTAKLTTGLGIASAMILAVAGSSILPREALAQINTTNNATNSPSNLTKSFSAFAERGKYNVFSIPKEPFLLLNAPVFQVLPLQKVSLPQSIVNDIFKKAEKVSGTQLPITSISVKPESLAESQPIENSLVNIFCSQKVDSSATLRKTITGSGVLINKDGTVITNAHVAQFPLIADSSSKVVCLARTGSPARSTHSVKVAFISPEWVKTHAQYINTSVPESGQNDYALLVISPINASSTKTNSIYPAVVQKDLKSTTDNTVLVAGYPAEILGIKGVNSALYSQKESVSIKNYYSFSGISLAESLSLSANSDSDVLETTATNIGQIGSSGGAVADIHNHLIALITTVVPNGNINNGSTNSAKNSIRAISMNYINKDISSYYPDGLTYTNSNGSSKIKSIFDDSYRKGLTSLLLQNLK